MALMVEMAKSPRRRPGRLDPRSPWEACSERLRFATRQFRRQGAYLALLVLVTTSAWSAGWTTGAGLQVSETWSDNIALAAAGSERHDLVTDVSPSVHLNSSGGRLGLSFDAALHGLQYANGTSGNRSNTTLNSTGKLEVLDKWLFVDGAASISQQSTSPFAGQNTSLANIDNNRSTVRNYSLAPYVQGMFGPEVAYNLRYQNSQNNTDSTTAGNTRIATATGGLKWGNSSRLLNFGADFSNASTSYTNQLSTTTRSIRATTYLNVDAHLNFSAFVGRESNNYSLTGQAGVSKGMNMQWAVSERTSLDLGRESHVYGPTFHLAFSHRMPRSAFQLSYSQTANITSTQGVLNAPSALYMSFLSLCTANSATPLECPTVVAKFLHDNNLASFTLLPFISNSTYIQRSLQGSLVLTGVRNTVSVTASRSDSRNDSATVLSSDILGSSNLILQRNLALNWALKLTPFSTLTTGLSRSHNSSSGVAASDTTYTSLNLLWSTQLTQKLRGSLNLRHNMNSVSAGATVPYRENAAVATIGYTY